MGQFMGQPTGQLIGQSAGRPMGHPPGSLQFKPGHPTHPRVTRVTLTRVQSLSYSQKTIDFIVIL